MLSFSSAIARAAILILPGALLSLALSACDRSAPTPAQPAASATATTAGTIDTSHAGELMPAIAVRDESGETLNLSAAQGEPVLLNLWATWCAPCVKEMPALDAIAGSNDALRVIAVSQDMAPEKVQPFFERTGVENLHSWLDPENSLAFHYEGGVLPLTILYDASGREVWRVTGEFDWTGAEARRRLDPAILG